MMHNLVCLAEMRSAVLLGAAHWDSKGDLKRLINEREKLMSDSILGTISAPEPWEPPSLDRMLKHMSPEDRAWVLASQNTSTS